MEATIEKRYRKMILIDKDELKRWKKVFSLFGTKSEFERLSGRSSVGLDKILKRGRGSESFLNAIREYVNAQNSPTKAA